MIKKIILISSVLFFAQNVCAEFLINSDDSIKKIFESMTHFEERVIKLTPEEVRQIESVADINFGQSHHPELKMYTVYQNQTIMGYAFEDTVIGKWGPIHYLAGLNNDATIREVMILDFSEIRGRKVAKRRFLKQYKGKSIKDPLRIRRDIDGVSGATITSRSLTDGIRKMVYMFDCFTKRSN